jgi:hypothetical protein
MCSLSVVRSWRVVIVLGVVAAGLIVSGAARASAATCKRTPLPNVGSRANSLQGVSATSARNAWAVGYYANSAGTRYRTLIEHWNDKAWKVQPSPNPRGSDDTVLHGVATTSSTNAWAVGDSSKDSGTYRTLIEHWNGKAWKIQESPNLAGTRLVGVAATSSTNAWAVGFYEYRNGTSVIEKTLIEHWNGKAWKVQASPNPGSDSVLFGVAATSSRNAWAVGDEGQDTLIERWNGRVWTVQASPNPQLLQDQYLLLSGVAATSATNAWAVGYAYVVFSMPTPGYNPMHTLIERWNGRAWKVQASPNPGEPQLGSELYDVAATSSTSAWAVGNYDGNAALIEHWNGRAWKVQASPNLSVSTLSGVAATSSRNAWAVGNYSHNAYPSEDRNLIEHCG